MGRNGDWMQRLRDQVALDAQTLPGVPLVEIAGQNRVLIENHLGVCGYGREQICVRVKYGQVSVRGCGLELARMSREQVVITGRIEAVCLMGRNP